MKISQWLFKRWFRSQLKETKDSPFKMKIETESLKSNCVAEILHEIEAAWLSVKRLEQKLGVKAVQNRRSRLLRDEFGKEVVLPDPVFSENQIAEIKTKHWLHLVIIFTFPICESFLYYLTAALFVPGGSIWMKIAVSAFLALLILLTLDYAFEKHFTYRTAVEKHSQGELTDLQLKIFRDTRNLAHLLIVLSFMAIICAGLSRVFFLENIQVIGVSAAKAESVMRASRLASIFSMFITVIAGLFMALVKQEQARCGIKYRVLQNWRKAHRKRNDYSQDLIKDGNEIKMVIESCIEKYWQLVIDLKRTYQMPNEYDLEYQTLYKEYITLRSRQNFTIDKKVYAKFSAVQCVDEALFRFGILQDKHIQEKMEYLSKVLNLPKEYVQEQLMSVIQMHPVVPHSPIPAPSVNGKSKQVTI